MFDFILNNLEVVRLYLPIGIIGLFRWGIWSIKKVIGLRYRPIPEVEHNLSLSVVTAVYNEDPKVFRRALDSWDGDEIIAVIDHQDELNIDVFQEFVKTTSQAKLIITPVPGKRPALALGIKAAVNEIVALVDSDTIWQKNIRQKALSPFVDPEVGGVATRQEVFEPNTLQGALFNILLSNRYFNEFPFLAKTGNALTCLSGRTAFYRRTAALSVADEMVNEKFLGTLCISGDDKALTRLVQEKGWKTRFMQNVAVMTLQAPSLLTFFKQQLRWLRNSWRSDLLTLASPWVWQREKIMAFYMIDRFIQPFILFLGPIYLIISLSLGHWLIAVILVIWWLVSRSLKILPHLKLHPKDTLIMPAYVVTTFITALIKIYALLTLNQQDWITRWDKSRLQKAAVVSVFIIAFFLANINAALAQTKPNITYNSSINTIEVKGTGAKTNLTAIFNALNNNNNLLERLGPSEWLLKANLKVFENATLELHGEQVGGDVSWLKLRSNPSGYVAIDSSNGNISIKNTKITSWDTGSNSFDTNFLDESGRAFISAKNRSTEFINRMDVINSEIAYLGFFEETAYGISWKVISEPGKGDTGELGKGITSTVENSKFHHNYYGLYLWGVGGLEARNNEIYENYRYGFDAHTQTNGTILEDNFSHDNGWHGIIFADRCTNNIIRRNKSINNKGHGIMLHKISDENIIEDNIVSGNDDGIPLFESSNNIIKNNAITGNNIGIRLYGRTRPSAKNIFENNTVSESKSYGVYLYDKAEENAFRNNKIIKNNDAGFYIPNVSDNTLANNLVQDNKIGVQLGLPQGSNTLQNNRLSQNQQGDILYPGQLGNIIVNTETKPNKWIIAGLLFGAVLVIALINMALNYFRRRKLTS